MYEFTCLNGTADPFADSDGDGVSNCDEMLWGASSNNALSNVNGPTVRVEGGVVRLAWSAAPYRPYELRSSSDLQTWQTVASGAISNYTEQAGSGPVRRFCRLAAALPAGGTKARLLSETAAGTKLLLGYTVVSGQVYELQASAGLTSWQVVSTNATPPYSVPLTGFGVPPARSFRLRTSGGGLVAADGLDWWEEALYVATFGVMPATRDNDGDGQNDLAEFQQGRQPGKKDHPAVGLVLFTPLKK